MKSGSSRDQSAQKMNPNADLKTLSLAKTVSDSITDSPVKR